MQSDSIQNNRIITLENKFIEFENQIYKVLRDDFTRTALRRAVGSFRSARDRALQEFPYVEEDRNILRETKDKVIENFDTWIDKAIKSIERSDAKAYFAKTDEDALKLIKDIVGSDKLIVKGKSITSEELDLNTKLEEWGNEVYETDLGEFIVQQLHSRPMHILAPAVNIPREKVAELFSKIAGKELPPDIPTLAKFASDFLRDKFINADIGITGANAITADTGSIFLIENEGNIRFVTNAPPVHIVIAGIEKILPTFRDGAILVEVLSRYAGYLATSYVSIISGPSKTGDIEKFVVYGAHGPKELHVILMDNGRSKVAKHPIMHQALRCLRCGACMYECPVYQLTTGYWGHKYMGGIGIPWTTYIAGGFELAAPLAFTCTLCGRCKTFCPMDIDIPEIVLKIREMLKEKELVPLHIRSMARTSVNEDICSGCGICVEVCPFEIPEIVKKNGKRVSQIDEASCMGCGTCVSACPSGATQAIGLKSNQLIEFIRAALR